jgi:hypothetical protein
VAPVLVEAFWSIKAGFSELKLFFDFFLSGIVLELKKLSFTSLQ